MFGRPRYRHVRASASSRSLASLSIFGSALRSARISPRSVVGQPFNLRKAEFSLLMLLLANGATVAKRLARTLRLSAPALTMLIDRMQDKHWLRRERNPADRRSQLIVLTPEGQALARRAQAVSKTMEAGLQRRLSRAERAMLIELLSKLAGHRDDGTPEAG